MSRLLLAALVLLAATPAAAQRTLSIERFDAAITVEQDGTVDVVETITARFTGSWNGIYRSIPVTYRTPQGANWTLDLDLVRATDPQGTALKVDSERAGHSRKFRIWVPGAQDATRTISLHYRARNGLRFFDQHDELYWNITGDEWDVPIQAASARITLPGAAHGVRAIAFNGAYGSTAHDARVVINGTTITVTMPKALGFHEGLTAVVGFDKGLVPEPTRVAEAVEFGTNNWPLVLPVFVFVGMYLIWRRVGRDPETLPVSVQYDPPAGMTPAEAGTLMDGSADMRDITATLVDLAVRGHLKIEEREDSHLLGLIKNKDYVFHQLKPAEGAPALVDHEEQVLYGVFDGGPGPVRLSDLENRFYRQLENIRSDIFGRLIKRGLYRSRPDHAQAKWFALAALFVFVGIGLGAWQSERYGLSPFGVFVGCGLSGIIVALFGRVMPARTVAGARALERVRGFEEFLERVEGERFKSIVKTPEMFERLLPYAMVFRVERQWARAFEGIYREPPTWYAGSSMTAFNAGMLTARLSDLTTRAGSTMSSAPRSSGRSGFSGGSSGGGSGGGGGGGF